MYNKCYIVVVPLPPEVVNSYIDKFPAIVLSKIKEKFESYAEKESKELTQLGFMKLYSPAKLPSVEICLVLGTATEVVCILCG